MVDSPIGAAASAVLMIRPAGFGFNEGTAATNLFQTRPDDTTRVVVQKNAVAEFDSLSAAIRGSGVEVIVIEDLPEPRTPDAVFPNNWISFHTDGTVVLYPMCARSRRLERRDDIVPILREKFGFHVTRVVDWTNHEEDGRFFEGTGSVVFDHLDRCAYASLSARTDPGLFAELAELLGYESIMFQATDGNGNRVYHTNVVMSIGDAFAIVAAEAICDTGERRAVLERLKATGRRLIQIGQDQMRRFAGNVLELQAADATRVLVMSTAARAAFNPQQLAVLEASVQIVASGLETIEMVGGGSARCMLAEVYLPRVL